jgi:uroporphyrinogen decarboxylase
MLSRRDFFYLCATAATAAPARMTAKARVDGALRGQEVDRTPFTFWHHFGLEKLPGARHAQATIDFHRKYRTDLVKVMSDFPYPKPAGKWYEPRVLASPFPAQLTALDLIREAIGDEVYFVETIFNPWNQATKISSKEEVMRLKREDPRTLLEALEAIAESQANHARKALAAGAAGIFLAIDNAQAGILTIEEYQKFSEPFDKLILERVAGARLNTLHLHGDKVYLEHFLKGWPAAVVNYSHAGTGIALADVRRQYDGVLMAGLDEVKYRTLKPAELKRQYEAARAAAGARFILAPGCSVPNDSRPAELARLPKLLGA